MTAWQPRGCGGAALEAAGQHRRVKADAARSLAEVLAQLDDKNEEHERLLVEATGQLEGSLSALRRLTNEIARTIDDGIDMLQPTG